MADNVKPRRRRWRVTLKSWGYMPSGEGAGIGRAYTRAMDRAYALDEFMTPELRATADSCLEAGRLAMRGQEVGCRVTVTLRGFTVEIERIR